MIIKQRANSSIGESGGLIILWLQVRALLRPPQIQESDDLKMSIADVLLLILAGAVGVIIIEIIAFAILYIKSFKV